MTPIEEFKQNLQADLDVAEAKLTELKARANTLAAEAGAAYDDQVDALEKCVAATRSKLHELGEAGDDAWENLKDGAVSAWGDLKTAVKSAVDTLGA